MGISSIFINEIKYHFTEIMTPKMCCSFISQSLPAILNYKANHDDLNSKTRVAYEVGHLILNQNRGGGKVNPYLMPWPGRFDSEHHYVSGFAFHANRSSKPGSSLLMALPIQLEAHPNTNIPQYFGFVTSNPLSSQHGNYNNVLFLHGIRHHPLWRASHNRCFAVVATDHWSPNELNEQSLYMYQVWYSITYLCLPIYLSLQSCSTHLCASLVFLH